MSKKKKEEKPVVLSHQELMPSVLGVINEKENSNWPIFGLVVFLILFVIFLPTISSYVSGEKQITFTPSGNGSDGNKPSTTPGEETVFYPYSSDLKVEVDGISVSNFSINRRDFSLVIENESEPKNYLVTHQLYLELYDENQTLLQRIKLPNENISKGEHETYTFELSVPTASISQVVIEEKTINDYPQVSLTKESDGTYQLVCTKGAEKLTYLFDAESKLYYITDVINYSSNTSNYQVLLTDYRQLSSQYNGYDGVTSNIVETGSGFTSTTTLSLEKVDLTNRTIRNSLDNKAYYAKDTEGKVVYFELSAMNYQCN